MNKFGIGFIFLCVLFLCSDVWACSCAGPKSVVASFEEAKEVFTAHVDILQKNANGHTEQVILKVDRVWKGEPIETLTIGLPRGGCAYWNFKDKTSYLIYAHASWDQNNPDRYQISMCSRTKPLNAGLIEVTYLDAIVAGQDPAAIDQALPGLLLNDDSPDIRVEAARKLGWLYRMSKDQAPQNTAEALIKATQDTDDRVKIEAASSLSNLYFKGTPGLKEALLILLQDDNNHVRRAASSAMSMIGIRESDVFNALKDSFEEVVLNKAELPPKEYEGMIVNLGVSMSKLAVTDDEKIEAVDLILPVLDEVHDPYSKVSIIQHLGFMKQHAIKTVPILIDTLNTANHYHLKQYVIHALGDIGAVDALEEIKPYLKDKNCYVVQSVVIAVGKIDPQGFGLFFNAEAMPVLQQRFDECKHQFIWGLQTVGEPAKDMEPFLREKYEQMDEGDWIKDSVKNLLDMWDK